MLSYFLDPVWADSNSSVVGDFSFSSVGSVGAGVGASETGAGAGAGGGAVVDAGGAGVGAGDDLISLPRIIFSRCSAASSKPSIFPNLALKKSISWNMLRKKVSDPVSNGLRAGRPSKWHTCKLTWPDPARSSARSP